MAKALLVHRYVKNGSQIYINDRSLAEWYLGEILKQEYGNRDTEKESPRTKNIEKTEMEAEKQTQEGRANEPKNGRSSELVRTETARLRKHVGELQYKEKQAKGEVGRWTKKTEELRHKIMVAKEELERRETEFADTDLEEAD